MPCTGPRRQPDNVMAVAAHKDGSLLVRVDPAENASLLDCPYASRAEMGAGRSMGEGWIQVARAPCAPTAPSTNGFNPPPATSTGAKLHVPEPVTAVGAEAPEALAVHGREQPGRFQP